MPHHIPVPSQDLLRHPPCATTAALPWQRREQGSLHVMGDA